MSSGKLDQYQYLAGEELAPKSGPIEKTRFEYSTLGQIYIKGLEEEEENKNYGLLKRLKNFKVLCYLQSEKT